MFRKLAILFMALMLVALPMYAQTLNSNTQSVALTMNTPESVTMNAPSASSVVFTYNPATNSATAAPATFTISAAWNLGAGHTDLYVASWLSGNSTGALLNGTGGIIPSADVFSTITGPAGTVGPTACTGTTLVGAVGFIVGAQCNGPDLNGSLYHKLLLSTANAGTTGTLTVGLGLSGLPANLQPGAYAGTMYFQVIVY